MSKIKLILYISAICALGSCRHEKKAESMPAAKVETKIVTIDSIFNHISVASQINGLNYATVQPRVTGFLRSIHFDGGTPVKRGDLLFTIDPSTFTTTLYSARAALESAQAAEALAWRNYERAEPLAQIDAISQSDLDQYRATYKAARASTKSAEEQLRSAQLEVGYTKIYAPISGIASKTVASRGDYIGLETLQNALTTITQLDTVSIEIAIPTAKYLQYVPSESFDNSTLLSNIELTLPDSTLYDFEGEYYYTLKNTPTASSTVVVVVKFPNPSLRLKEGMFARVRANIGNRKGCITVPRSAVSQIQGINSVWVVSPDSTAEWRAVTLGECYNDQWDVTQGLAEGENVVVSGGMKLHKGVKVAASAVK